MKTKERAVVTVIGKDKVGILSKVSNAVALAQCNIIDVTQSVLEDFFCMIMIIDIKEAEQSIEELKKTIEGYVPEMQVHVMHEEIFNSMHRI